MCEVDVEMAVLLEGLQSSLRVGGEDQQGGRAA
jgi:hypothetical protein